MPTSWAQLGIEHRLQWVRSFRSLVAANSHTLISFIVNEIGKSEWEAFSGDVLPLLAACRWHERHARRILSTSRVAGTPMWLVGHSQTVRRVPLGRVGIIATWNYPVQLLGIQLLQALVAGNDVVVKPSERSPRTQTYLVKLAREAGLRDGTLELRDHAREAGEKMLASERFDKIIFTGSTEVGRRVARAAAEMFTPSALELSGCDSALVLNDADPSLAARTIWHAATMNAGQTCLAPRRALVDARAYHDFLAALAPLAAAARPLPVIDASAARHTFGLAHASLDHGARSLSGVLEPPSGRSLRAPAMVDCPIEAPLASEDHFGPALAVVPCDNLNDMLAAHARIQRRLATSVFTSSPATAESIADGLGTSTVCINDCILPSSHPGSSIAGSGLSGWGVTRGAEGLLAMTRLLQISSTHTRRRLPIEPPSPKHAAMLRRWLLWWYAGDSNASRDISPD